MKTVSNRLMLTVLLVLVPAFLSACDSNDNAEADELIDVDDNGYTRFNRGALEDAINALPKEDLSAAETASLLFMREEEKLARDVYLTLYDQWVRHVFDNISESEETHTEAVLLLIDKYDLTDPAGGNQVGVFINENLQALHDTFVVQGDASLIEALKAGAAIEEVDIVDLLQALDQTVDNQDVVLVYENLMKGSRNHLRAFVRNLTQLGVDYTPHYLSQDQYEAILSSPVERGRQ